MTETEAHQEVCHSLFNFEVNDIGNRVYTLRLQGVLPEPATFVPLVPSQNMKHFTLPLLLTSAQSPKPQEKQRTTHTASHQGDTNRTDS